MKMKNISILLFMMSLVMASCGKETPFNDDPVTVEEGSLAKKALGVDVLDASMVVTRAGDGSGVSLDDFDIYVYQTGVSTPKFHDKYGNMPEILTLPRGEYYVEASYGENVDKGWEAPYYKGQSESFLIKGGEITDDIGEIKCRLTNVKVSVDFGPVLLSKVSNPNVEVKVCDVAGQDVATGLTFTKLEAEKERCGFFRYEPGVTLVAVFDGLIDGDLTPTHEVKTITNLEGGKHYKITFKLHVIDGDPGGGIAAKMAVDAHLVVTDVERNVDIEEDEILDDNERPNEGGDTPPSGSNGPEVKVGQNSPLELTNEKVVGNKTTVDCNYTAKGDGTDVVILDFSSISGFKEFYADIVSPNLTPEELSTVGLADHLDLINPGALEEPLTNLGLPVNIGGEKNVKFDISKFMTLLAIFGSNEHTFVITSKDNEGDLVVNLKIKFE